MRNISDLREKTNDYFGDVEYIPMDEIIDQDIGIMDAVTFDNKDGVATAAFKFARLDAAGNVTEDVYKTTTHAGPIVDMLAKGEVIDLLMAGEIIGARVVEKKSKKSGRTYRTFA